MKQKHKIRVWSFYMPMYQCVVKGQNNFWQQNAFLTCSWRFLTSHKLEQLEFKLEKILGFRNMQEKLEKLL